MRTCNFDIQILIQSKKENILNSIENINLDNNENVNFVKKEYISYIKSLNLNSKMSSKNFFILISIPKENIKKEKINIENIKNKFIDRIFKINDTLSKCGNRILEISEKREVINILDTFINPYKN